MTPEQAALLRVKFDPKEIGQLPRAGIKLDYVGHAAVTDRLLKVDPLWTWEPFALAEDGRPLVIVRGGEYSFWIRLTVCGVTRIGVGTVRESGFEIEKQLIGDAIRNAAMRFGVALDLWSKEELSGFDTGAGPGSSGSQEEPAGAPVNADDLQRGDGSPAPVLKQRRAVPTGPNPVVRERDNEPRQ